MDRVACPHCQKTFKNNKYCASHLKNVHKINVKGEPVVKLEKPKQSFACVVCDKLFQTKQNMKRHFNSIHLIHTNDCKTYQCTKCSHTSTDESNLKRHMKLHNENWEKKVPTLQCQHCSAKFGHARSLKQHERKQHQIKHPGTLVKRKCPVCLVTFYGKSKEGIHSHFQQKHGIKINWEYHSFNSISEFKIWKQQIEKKTTSMYTKTSSSSNSMIFQCHRCGMYKKKGNDKRHIKMMGSCKINSFCPAVIKVKLKQNGVSVQFLSTHIGHKNELKHIHLTAEERRGIATQLAGKTPHEEILKGIRGSITNSDLQRIHLTNKKDILNIEKSFNLNDEAMKHPYDPVSVEAWVNDLKKSEDTALLVYKPQGVISESFPLLKECRLLSKF